jgi:hypothetical protein
MRFLYFFFLMLLHVWASAQSRHMRLYIKASEDHEPIEHVKVMDMNSQISATSDADGYVAIYAQPGHELQIQRMGISTKKLIVTERMLKAIQVVFVSYDRQQMDTFELVGKTKYQLDSIERAERYTRALSHQKDKPELIIAPGALIITNPISSWMQYIASTTRAKFKFQNRFLEWERQKYIETKYRPQLVASLTGIQGDSLAWFMNAFPMTYDMARYQAEIVIKSWIKSNFEEWNSNKNKYIQRFLIKQ